VGDDINFNDHNRKFSLCVSLVTTLRNVLNESGKLSDVHSTIGNCFCAMSSLEEFGELKCGFHVN
jgi:hypothetical protein